MIGDDWGETPEELEWQAAYVDAMNEQASRC